MQARARRDPYEQKITLVNLEHHSQREPQPSHLFPEDASQIKRVTRSDKQAEQANEHDEK